MRSSPSHMRANRNRLKFNLICDPSYQEGRSTTRFPPISVCRPGHVITSRDAAYDLGWTVRADQLPKGQVRFTVTGAAVERLVTIAMIHESVRPRRTSIDLTINCFKVRHGKLQRDSLKKRWRLLLATDPATGFPSYKAYVEVFLLLWLLPERDCRLCPGMYGVQAFQPLFAERTESGETPP